MVNFGFMQSYTERRKAMKIVRINTGVGMFGNPCHSVQKVARGDLFRIARTVSKNM